MLNDPFFRRKINVLTAFLLIILFSLMAAAFALSQAAKLKQLYRPMPLELEEFSSGVREK